MDSKTRDSLLLAAVIGFSLLSGVGTAVLVSKLTRGMRNNNPGNLRPGSQWVGIAGQDGGYLVFDTMENGVRALGKLLLTYSSRYGLNTVAGIISRWAPSSENDTASYINAVSKALGVAPNTPLDVRGRLPELALAISKHENAGLHPSPEQMAEGIRRALV